MLNTLISSGSSARPLARGGTRRGCNHNLTPMQCLYCRIGRSVGRLSWRSCARSPLVLRRPARRITCSSTEDGHVPVLLHEVLDAFKDVDLQVHVDGTLGAGGHAAAVIEAHPEMRHFIGIDQDEEALLMAKNRLRVFEDRGTKLHFVKGNFRALQQHLASLGTPEVDGLLLDLGVSSMQLDRAHRGFSFMQDGPLDMRMDSSAPLSAEEVVNTWSEQALGKLIREYGEDKKWRTIARRIVEAREVQRIATTEQLELAIGETRISSRRSRRAGGSSGPHPATRTFQALRIAVNDELRACEDALPAALRALRPAGRLAVISFHSLEDRIVKWALREAAGQGRGGAEAVGAGRGVDAGMLAAAAAAAHGPPTVRLVSRRPITAAVAELAANPRARSAKLRVVEKLTL
eukprot:jgi/Ulvmu1/1151/UM107_0025.1